MDRQYLALQHLMNKCGATTLFPRFSSFCLSVPLHVNKNTPLGTHFILRFRTFLLQLLQLLHVRELKPSHPQHHIFLRPHFALIILYIMFRIHFFDLYRQFLQRSVLVFLFIHNHVFNREKVIC